jgi:hypothetical protein
MRKLYERTGPYCKKCNGTIVAVPAKPELAECFSCGKPYKLNAKGELVI